MWFSLNNVPVVFQEEKQREAHHRDGVSRSCAPVSRSVSDGLQQHRLSDEAGEGDGGRVLRLLL